MAENGTGYQHIALVTGAGGGIGFEVCRQLAERGMTVILTARNPEKAEAAAKEPADKGLDVRPVTLDVSDDESARRLASEIENEFGRLDVLINNAAAFVDWTETALTADLEAAHAVFETNLFGAWRASQAFVPLLRRSEHGRIVNVFSGAGSHGEEQFRLTTGGGAVASYGISKAAVNALTAKLAAELEGTGILVNSVCPGLTATAPGMEEMGARPVPEGRRERGVGCHPPRRRPGRRFLPRRRAATLVGVADRILTLRELNRATLARQMLLEREQLPVLEAVERLAGLQAQVPNPPYVGLWTRLRGFLRDDLTRKMEERRIVRAAMMRSTLHLVTAEDHRCFRPTIQPALTRALGAFFGKRAKELDIEKLVEAARPFIEEEPRSTGELRSLLAEVESDEEPGGDGLRRADVPAARPGAARRYVGQRQPDVLHHRLLLARRGWAHGEPARTALPVPGGLRSGDRDGLPGLVRHDAAQEAG